MPPRALLLCGLLAFLAVSPEARQSGTPPVSPPAFRASVDLMQLDVSVLDRNRRPVTGLKASDFTILENGTPRIVQTLLEIDVPPVQRGTPSARTDVSEPVATNATVRDARRIVVIVIDDISLARLGRADAYASAKTREVARRTVDELGPQDLAAVVHTNNTFSAQSLTTDRRRLLTAIEGSSLATSSDEGLAGDETALSGECMCGLCSPETLGNVAAALGTIRDRRKTVVFISAGIVLPPAVPEPANPCFLAPFAAAMEHAFSEAQRANVNIHAFDPTGLVVSATTIAGIRGAGPNGRTVMGISSRQEYLRAVAENTGGRVVTNNNDPDRQVKPVLDESRSYYLLGFQPADLARDGRRRKLEVRVNRRNVTVAARDSYLVPKAGDVLPPEALAANRLLPETRAELHAIAAPLARSTGQGSVAIALGFEATKEVVSGETIELVARATSQVDGDTRSFKQTFRLHETPEAIGQRVELLTKLPVPPGRYDIRLGLVVAGTEWSGVSVSVDVPTFAKDRLSVSDVLLSEAPARGLPRDALADLAPVVPTTRRSFSSSDRVRAFVRAYQRPDAPAPTARVSIADSAGTIVSRGTAALGIEPFGKLRVADCSFDLPLARLAPGQYVVRIEITSGKNTAERTTGFVVE